MRKAFIASAVLASATLGFKAAKHPFVGEHANANAVHREDGGIS